MPNAELSLASLPADSLVHVERDGANLLLIHSRGRVFAYQDKCPHAFWPLSQGTLTGTVLECPGHGWEFDIQTGRCINAPAYCLNSVAVTVSGDIVRLVWSDAEKQESCIRNSRNSATEATS